MRILINSLILTALFSFTVTANKEINKVASYYLEGDPLDFPWLKFSYSFAADLTYGTGYEAGTLFNNDVPSSCYYCFQYEMYYCKV
jgi:hypothetical protein